MIGRDWYDAAQDRRDDELRGHAEGDADRRAHYDEVFDAVARHAPADSTTAELHREARRLLRSGS